MVRKEITRMEVEYEGEFEVKMFAAYDLAVLEEEMVKMLKEVSTKVQVIPSVLELNICETFVPSAGYKRL